MIAVKLVIAEHSQVRHRERAAAQLGWGDRSLAHLCGQRGVSPSRSLPGTSCRRRTPSARSARRLSARPIRRRPRHRRSRERAAAVCRRGSSEFARCLSRSASALAFTTMSLYVGASAWPMRFSSVRSATHASMSTSACSAKSGIVAFDSAIRRAIVCCVRVSSTVVVSPLAVVTSGRRCGGWAPPAEEAGPASAPTTSALTILPLGPLPVSVLKSMSFSRAIRRATGDALRRSPAAAGALLAYPNFPGRSLRQ